ncbi:MAG: plastocyanin/azurin family copper-binding protein [Gemmatimonadales bacterium]
MRPGSWSFLLATVLTGCGGSSPTNYGGSGGGGGGAGGVNASVSIQDFSYTNATVSIKAGSEVTWSNNGPSSHTATSDTPGVFNSGTLPPPSGGDPYGGGGVAGGTFKVKLNTPGTYPYTCAFHPTMHGTVNVTP